MKQATKNMRVLDTLADEAANHALEHEGSTKESRAAAERYGSFVSERVAEMRRADLENVPVTTERRPVRRSLLAMGRDALLAQLAKLQEASPVLAFAHHDLSHVTDDDLRTMIDDAEQAMGLVRDPS